MLTDQKPVDIKGVDGVIVYADATSPLIFYYASTTPQISGAGAEAAFNLMRFDPGTEESQATFRCSLIWPCPPPNWRACKRN